jgi:hypothetical protein
VSVSGALVRDEGRVHHAAAIAPKRHLAAVEIPEAAQIKGGMGRQATRLALLLAWASPEDGATKTPTRNSELRSLFIVVEAAGIEPASAWL